MNADDIKASKAQLRAAQRLIEQFEDGSGRHNSNLAAAGRDAVARVELSYDHPGWDWADLVRLRAIAIATRERLIREFLLGITVDNIMDCVLVNEGLLRADPRDCALGQLVSLDQIQSTGPWAVVRVPGIGTGQIFSLGGRIYPVAVAEVLEERHFERVRYCYNPEPSPGDAVSHGIEREFWKRVA